MNIINHYNNLFSTIFAKHSLNNHTFYQLHSKFFIELDRQLYGQMKISVDDKDNLCHYWKPVKIKPFDIFKREIGIKVF